MKTQFYLSLLKLLAFLTICLLLVLLSGTTHLEAQCTTCSSLTEVATVPSNQIWPMNLTNAPCRKTNVTIPSGVTVTVDGTVYLSPNVEITVQPGGTLNIISTGELLPCPGSTWKGIMVEGYKTGTSPNFVYYKQRTEPTSGYALDNFNPTPVNHGIVKGDGATIEGMTDGIRSEAGGIIYFLNSTFSDNLISIKASDYPYAVVNGEIDKNRIQDVANRVEKCTFKWTQTFPGKSNYSSNVFIRLDQIYGFEISGCSFENEDNTQIPVYLSGQERGVGIDATYAAFTVDQNNFNIYDYADGNEQDDNTHCPDYTYDANVTPTRSSFKYLSTAIQASSYGASAVHDARVVTAHTDFTDNLFDINIHDGGTHYIGKDNTFTANNSSYNGTTYFQLNTTKKFINMDNTTAFVIGENTFSATLTNSSIL